MTVNTYKRRYHDERIHYKGEIMLLGGLEIIKSTAVVRVYASQSSTMLKIQLSDIERYFSNGTMKFLYNGLLDSQRNFLNDITRKTVVEVSNLRFDSSCKHLVEKVVHQNGYLDNEKLLLNQILNAFQKGELILTH